jgi:hypothetical protein
VQHKLSTSRHLTLINYMARPFGTPERGDQTYFLSFVPINLEEDNWNWGVEIDGIACCAVHLVGPKGTGEPYWWGDDPRDTEENARANPWVLMFYGSDNSSWFSRYSTKEAALDAFKTLDTVYFHEHLSYNS